MGIFSKIFARAPSRRVSHPVFGEMLLVSAKRSAYWEVETVVEGKPFFVAVDTADGESPTDAQAAFFRRYAEHPDLAFERVRSLLVPEFEAWARLPFPADWRSAFRLSGMSVPVGGDEQGSSELTFERVDRDDDHLFTCTLARGVVQDVHIDG